MQTMNARKAMLWIPWALAAAVTTILCARSLSYVSHLFVLFGIYLLLAYSLNLVTGFGGLIVFCHASFFGVGAFTYALVRLRSGTLSPQVSQLLWTGDWTFFPGLMAAAVVGALSAWLLACISLRFRGDYFIFATLGFQMIVFVVLYNWVELSRGPFGIYGIPRPTFCGWIVSEPWEYVLLTGLILLATLPILIRLYHSPFGLALQTLREDERAARAMGINTTALATWAIVMAGGFAGIAGALYASYITYIEPTSFSLRESIFLVALLMLGGGGNVKGPFVGTGVMLALPEALRFLGLPTAVAANVREIIYGALLAALMYWRPRGLAGVARIRS